jgi:hypothetical protein
VTQPDPLSNVDLAAQRTRLKSLETCEENLRAFRERESELEVDYMAEEAALRRATARIDRSIDPTLALRIGVALERRREIEEGVHSTIGSEPGSPSGSADTVDAMRAGRAALQMWLDDSKGGKSPGPALAGKITLLIATLASVWAAVALHPAFLVLLLVVIGPVSFAMGRGQDKDWRRVGARRRYDFSGLAGISDWNEDAVRARLQELDELLVTSGGADTRGPVDEHQPDPLAGQDAAVMIAEIDAGIAADLEAAGLSVDDTRGDTEKWLRLVARADRARRSLEQVKYERGRLKSEAAELRGELQQFLQSLGTKATDQPDTAAEIAARLDRLSDSR